jgi:hypothetical protein
MATMFFVVIGLGVLIVTALCIAGFVVLIMWIVKSANRPARPRRVY